MLYTHSYLSGVSSSSYPSFKLKIWNTEENLKMETGLEQLATSLENRVTLQLDILCFLSKVRKRLVVVSSGEVLEFINTCRFSIKYFRFIIIENLKFRTLYMDQGFTGSAESWFVQYLKRFQHGKYSYSHLKLSLGFVLFRLSLSRYAYSKF